MNIIDIILENFKNAEKVFTDEGANPDDLKEYIEKFKELKNKNIIKSPYSDINHWTQAGWDKFRTFIISYRQFKTGKEIKQDIKTSNTIPIYDGVNVSVYIPLTKEASCLYGAKTKWCVSARNDNKFDYYKSNSSFLLFFITKDYIPKKFAIFVDIPPYGEPVLAEIRNSSDKPISTRQLQNGTKLDSFNLNQIVTKSFREYMDFLTKNIIKHNGVSGFSSLPVDLFKNLKNYFLKNSNYNALFNLRIEQHHRIPELEKYLFDQKDIDYIKKYLEEFKFAPQHENSEFFEKMIELIGNEPTTA